MEKVYILLPVHNRVSTTARFVECLSYQTHQSYELILIDDGSKDGTEAMVRQRIFTVIVLKGVGDWWWGGSLQQGYVWLLNNSVSDNDVVLVINDDTVFDADFLARGVEVLKKHPASLLMAYAFDQGTKKLVDKGMAVDWAKLSFGVAESVADIDVLSTRGLFLRFGDMKRIGGFRPKLLPHYASDYEFTIRAKKKGLRLVTDPQVRLFSDSTTTGYHGFKREPLWTFLGKYFSKRSAINPVTWTVFVLLCCPRWSWKLWNLARIWKKAFVDIWKFGFKCGSQVT